jgi:hypothetical protein
MRKMWTLFFILALVGTILLLIYLLIKLNELENKASDISTTLKKHFEPK